MEKILEGLAFGLHFFTIPCAFLSFFWENFSKKWKFWALQVLILIFSILLGIFASMV
ncbi:MAG: hypothetical protein HFJ37_03250 [Clostridia bacterium]|nr:hypothetical protein [Clostridia bacterium]